MLEDPDFLQGLFLSILDDNSFQSSDDQKTVALLAVILHELNNKTLTVNKVYLKSDRTDYLSEVYKKTGLEIAFKTDDMQEMPQKTSTIDPQKNKYSTSSVRRNAPSPLHMEEPANKIYNLQGGKTPSYSANDNRKKLITSRSGKITGISNQKAINVYAELKQINCEKTPIVAGFGIRVFIEISLKVFLEKTGKYQKSYRSKISTMLNVCHETIISHGNDDQKNHAKDIIIGSKNGEPYIEEIESLNIAVHSTMTYFNKNEIFAAWDKYVPFLQDLWEYSNIYMAKKK